MKEKRAILATAEINNLKSGKYLLKAFLVNFLIMTENFNLSLKENLY